MASQVTLDRKQLQWNCCHKMADQPERVIRNPQALSSALISNSFCYSSFYWRGIYGHLAVVFQTANFNSRQIIIMLATQWARADCETNAPPKKATIRYTHISIRRTEVCATGWKGVLVLVQYASAEELVEDGDKRPPVPVISDTPTIVTLASQVAHSSKRNMLHKKEVLIVQFYLITGS